MSIRSGVRSALVATLLSGCNPTDSAGSTGLTLIMGQSNATDQGDTTEVAASYSDPFPVQYDYRMFLGAGPTQTDYSGQLAPRPVNHFGIELSLGRAMTDRGIIKYSQGSTSLAVDWAPASSLRTGAIAFAHGIEARDSLDVTSIIWMQGEADSTDSAQSLAYGANLDQLFDELLTEFPNATIYYYKLPVVGTYSANVRNGQYLAQSSRAVMVDVDDIPLTGFHFTSAGLITLGERFANVIAATENPADTAITVDATSGYARPMNASEVTKLLAGTGIPNPDNCWPCIETSGSLVDIINGSLALAPFGSPLYAQTATGWAVGGVKATTDNSTDGFQAAVGSGPSPATTSQTWLFVLAMPSYPAATRVLGGLNVNAAPAQVRLQITPSTGNKLRIVCDGVTATGTVNHTTGTRVFGFTYDRTNSRVVAYSDLEALAGTYSAGVADGNKGFGRQNTYSSAVCLGIYLWHGTKSEGLSDANIATIISRIQSPPS